jgi:hypothetical protein
VVAETKKELLMKLSKISIAFFGAALLFASSALAGDTNKGTLNVSEQVSVDGKTLNPGTYKVQWDGTGPTVQVTLLQGKQTVATFSAHLTEQSSKNSQNAYTSSPASDGSRALTAIYLGSKHAILEVEQNGNAQQSDNQGSK